MDSYQRINHVSEGTAGLKADFTARCPQLLPFPMSATHFTRLYAFRRFQVDTQMQQTSRLSKIGLFQLSTKSTISTRVHILLYFYKSASTELLWEFLLRSAQGGWVTVDCFEELAHQCLLDTSDTIMIQYFEDDFMDMCRNVHMGLSENRVYSQL